MKRLMIVLTFFCLLSCNGEKKEAFNVFNEGVSLSMDAVAADEHGEHNKAVALNEQALLKFKETLQLDSLHRVARSALAHCLYVKGDFKDAIHWFEESNKIIGPEAENYREIGLCKMNVGLWLPGKADIDKALSIDTSAAIRNETIKDLLAISNQAWEYRDGYIENKDTAMARNFGKIAIGVRAMAYEYDTTRKEIAKTIADYGVKTGDKNAAAFYIQESNH